MKMMTRILCMAAVLCMLSLPGQAKGWEPVKTEVTEYRRVASDGEIDIRTEPGHILITTTKNINIKIFTILGSQIANDNLSAGTYRLGIPAHGVYIVKAGELTCKVAV